MNTDLVPSKQSLALESQTWADKARALRIVDAATCVNASHLLKSIKSVRAEIATWFAPHIEGAMETKRKAEAARKALADEKDRMEAPLVTAEALIKGALLTWEQEQEHLRREEEQRLQLEAQRQADAIALNAAAALEREAVATGDAEMLQEAMDLLEQPTEAPVVAVKTFVPKVQGISYRDNWKAHDDINVRALAAAVADGSAPTTFLIPNQTALNAYARATKGTATVPGVRFINDRQVAARQ